MSGGGSKPPFLVIKCVNKLQESGRPHSESRRNASVYAIKVADGARMLSVPCLRNQHSSRMFARMESSFKDSMMVRSDTRLPCSEASRKQRALLRFFDTEVVAAAAIACLESTSLVVVAVETINAATCAGLVLFVSCCFLRDD